MTTIQVYRNRRNSNKYIEVHNDGHYHNSLKKCTTCAEGIRCDRNDRQQPGGFSKGEIDKCSKKDRKRRKKKCMK